MGKHTEIDLLTEGWKIVVAPGVETVTGVTFENLLESQKYPIGRVIVHPKYDQKCNQNFDIALLEINTGNKNGLLPSTQLNVTLQGSAGPIFEPKQMGWGLRGPEDSSEAPLEDLRVTREKLNISSDGDCQDGWPEFNHQSTNADPAPWLLCTVQDEPSKGGPGPCQYDIGSPLFWSPPGTTDPMYLLGLLSQVTGGSCPKQYAGWSKITELKDFICQYGDFCENDTGATSLDAQTGMCRWTAIKIHNVIGLVLCGFLLPLSLGIQAVTYEMAPKTPDKGGALRVSLLYLRDSFPTSHNGVLFMDGLLLLMSIVATLIVALGIAPNNGQYAHSVLGYLVLALMLCQAALITVTRLHANNTRWNDPLSREYQVHRVEFFNQFLIYVLSIYILCPLGILRTGYGESWFFAYYGYLGFLHLVHLIYHLTSSNTKSAVVVPAKDPNAIDLTPMSELEQLEEKNRQNRLPPSRRASQYTKSRRGSMRAKSSSPSRRTSLNDHFKPAFVKDEHVGKEERMQSRRQSISDRASYKQNTSVFEQLGDHIKRRNSVTEGISAFFEQEDEKPIDLDGTKNKGDTWKSMRRASISGERESVYKGARGTSNEDLDKDQAEWTERRASTRRGSMRSMN